VQVLIGATEDGTKELLAGFKLIQKVVTGVRFVDGEEQTQQATFALPPACQPKDGQFPPRHDKCWQRHNANLAQPKNLCSTLHPSRHMLDKI
jgi:hypothetical protein